jgi:hypothetical protein
MEYNMDAKARADNRLRQQKYRELHRDEINEKRRERYEQRKTNNRCPRCGGKVKKGYTLCEDCCGYQGELNKKYAKERKTQAGPAKTARKTTKAVAAKKAGSAKKPVKKAVSPKKAAGPKKPVKKTVKRK